MQFEALCARAKRVGAQLARLYDGSYLLIWGTTRHALTPPATRDVIEAATCASPVQAKPWRQLDLDLDTLNTPTAEQPNHD